MGKSKSSGFTLPFERSHFRPIMELRLAPEQRPGNQSIESPASGLQRTLSLS